MHLILFHHTKNVLIENQRYLHSYAIKTLSVPITLCICYQRLRDSHINCSLLLEKCPTFRTIVKYGYKYLVSDYIGLAWH